MGSIFNDGSTPVDAAMVNKLVKTDGSAQYQILGYRIYYSSGWQVWDLAGNTQSRAAISLSWDNTLDRLDIDVSALSAYSSEFSTFYPAVIVSPSYRTGASPAEANLIPQAHAIGVNDIAVRFFDVVGSPGTLTHQTVINTRMDFNILLFGYYST